jgi:hypothetical protein
MTTEDHRKEVRGRLISMLKCAEQLQAEPAKIGPIVYDLGVLLSHLSEISEISSVKMERLTRQLIYLTWALVAFTAVLLILTFELVKRG